MRVLIAGASRGIGLALCEAFAERGDHVIAAVRRGNAELEALGVQVVEGVALISDEDVAKLPTFVGPEGLDVLIYNAAINRDSPGLEDIDVEVLKESYDVNALGSDRRAHPRQLSGLGVQADGRAGGRPAVITMLMKSMRSATASRPESLVQPRRVPGAAIRFWRVARPARARACRSHGIDEERIDDE
jgi:NAD(P)-dependent dehydrogenase (short-subunit alcohol dehydrogenase family)